MSSRKRLTAQEAADRKFSRRVEQLLRDQTIYDQVVVWKHRQIDVARDFQLTQARVSQIVARISRLKAEQAERLGQALGLPSQRLAEKQIYRDRLETALPLLDRHLREASAPLKTTRTRKDGDGNVIFVEETVREVKPSVQLFKLTIGVSRELVELADLPPAEVQVESETVELVRQNAHLRAANEHEELTFAAEALAERRKRSDELAEKQLRAQMGKPNWDEDLSTPERWGYCFARRQLTQVAEGSVSLADVEALNKFSSESNGAAYPSYFEICDENINGVRVAPWVRELVPEPRLPTDDEAYLPCLHNLADWNPHAREVVPYDTQLALHGYEAYRFGRLETEVGSAGPAEPDEAQDATPWSARSASGTRPQGDGSAQSPLAEREDHDDERRALAELGRTFRLEMWAERANNMTPTLLSEGKANLFYQGYTREQYNALLAWQRVMERKANAECGVRNAE